MIKLSVKQQNKDAILDIMNAGVNEITARILYNRGCRTKDDAALFLDVSEKKIHSPFLLPDIVEAVKIILNAIEENKKITIYGDYDCDGVTSTTILLSFLKSKGANAEYYIPNRLTEGYGINIPAIEKIAANGTDLIITVDNGTASASEISYGLSLGLQFVVTDHHECQDSNGININLPKCPVVNPKRSDSQYPFRDLAGVGVTYKLICAINNSLIEPEYLGYTAMGTVADIMPLIDENRILVSKGLKILSENTPVGIRELLTKANSSAGSISTSDISFIISPRINAAGRMETPDIAVKLLSTKSFSEANMLAEKLCELNLKRQLTESDILKEAENKLIGQESEPILIEKDPHWHIGTIGIVASKISEKYNKPCILLTEDGDYLKGSCRSIVGLNIYNLLSESVGDICKFGGHEMAAGVTIAIENYDLFKEKLLRFSSKYIQDHDNVKTIEAECNLSISDININTFDELSRLEPCGADNPQPLFIIKDVTVTEAIPLSRGKYTKLTLSDGISSFTALDFAHSFSSLPITENEKVNIIGELNSNSFRGERTISVFVKAIEGTDSGFGSSEAKSLIDSEQEYQLSKKSEVSLSITRNNIAGIYKILSKLYENAEIRIHPMYLKKVLKKSNIFLSYLKIRICMDILSEIGILKYTYEPNRNYADGNIYVITEVSNTKTSLDDSETYKKQKATD